MNNNLKQTFVIARKKNKVGGFHLILTQYSLIFKNVMCPKLMYFFFVKDTLRNLLYKSTNHSQVFNKSVGQSHVQPSFI